MKLPPFCVHFIFYVLCCLFLCMNECTCLELELADASNDEFNMTYKELPRTSVEEAERKILNPKYTEIRRKEPNLVNFKRPNVIIPWNPNIKKVFVPMRIGYQPPEHQNRISKLQDSDLPLYLPTRQHFGPDPIFPHFDPMFRFMSQMMDNLVNQPFEQINAVNSQLPDDSTLKFWMQNENTATTKNKDSHNGKDNDIEPTEISDDEDYPDYKTDLWRKFNKQDDEKDKVVPSNNTDRITFVDLDSKNSSHNMKSNSELLEEPNKPAKRNAWYYRLLSKGKLHGIIHRIWPGSHHKASPSPSLRTEVMSQLYLNGSFCKNFNSKQAEDNGVESFLELAVICSMLAILLIMCKLYMILYKDYKTPRLPQHSGNNSLVSMKLNELHRRYLLRQTPRVPVHKYTVRVPIPTSATPQENFV